MSEDKFMNEEELSWMFLGGLSLQPVEERDGIFDLFSWDAYEHIIRQTEPVLETLIWLYQVPADGTA